MERIVLEVDDTVGRIYKDMSGERKQQLNQMVSLVLKKAENNATYAEYSKLLDKIGNDAVNNGLTPDVLAAILASND